MRKNIFETTPAIYFKEITPIEFTKEVKGKKYSRTSDLEVIQGIIFKYNPHPELLNVAVYYTLKFLGVQLNDGYVEKVIEGFQNEDIESVEQAMKHLEVQHDKYTIEVRNERKKNRTKKMTKDSPFNVNHQLEHTFNTFKNLSSTTKKKELLFLMKSMIDDNSLRKNG